MKAELLIKLTWYRVCSVFFFLIIQSINVSVLEFTTTR